MAIILGVYNRKQCVGYCNASCYNAMQPSQLKKKPGADVSRKKTPCRCICGGANHAAGLLKAVKNHERGVGLRPTDLLQWCELHGCRPEDVTVVDRLTIPDDVKAHRIATARLDPPPLAPDDLFVCEEVS